HSLGATLDSIFKKDPWLVLLAQKTINEARCFTSHEARIARRFGSTVDVAVTTREIFDEKGEKGGALILIKDLSGIKSIEAESFRKERLAYIGAFAANLAHEVRNPLGGIRGAAQLLSRRLKEPCLKEYTDIIIKETERLESIVREMLDFTKSARLKKKPLNIHMVLDKVSLLLLKGDKHTSLIKEYDPSLPLVAGDEDRLSQVFLNLVKNAKEAAGGAIWLVTRMVTDFHLIEKGERGLKLVTIEVRDNGPGIPAENKERIFTPFFTTKKGGSGLGMAISYRIVKEHGGFFRVESEPGKGTSMFVYLPTAGG
ncbi:MAG: PAS domain-containing sensor histidine kinase, partial [Deltaproteobacteria bacterium]|nr:PAS domain-containing sensor histidine kinase [Deltaproteobacteria bacterium]